MKSFFLGRMHRLPVVPLWLMTAGLLATACKKDSEASVDYTVVDDGIIKKYLADNAITIAQKQPSGLYYEPVTTNATAALPTAGQVVSVLYTGRLMDGTVFDASSQHGNYAFSFVVGNNQVIPGFAEGVSLMHKGDKAVLLIPSGLAYGAGGSPPAIPANAVIRFEVELVDINPSFAIPDDNLFKQYLTNNKITTAQKQPSGLYFVPGTTNPTAAQATAGKTASVLYTGKFLDGTVFDASSLHNNTPLNFVVGAKQVAAGFDEGVSLMHKGDKAQLLIPSALGYGPAGAGNSIPPNTVLVFDIELVDVK